MKRVLVFAAVLIGVVSHSALAGGWSVKDASNRQVEISDTSRIVTIGGAVTEIVYALGFGDKVVAIDLTSTYPPEVKQRPSVGYMRALSPEGVLSLAPTVVLAIEGSGPPDAIEVLTRASVPFALVPEGYTEEAVLKKIRFVAAALGVPAKGEELAKLVAEDFAALTALRAKITARRNAIFVLAVGNGTPTVAGEHTSAEGIFALGGVDNAIKGLHGYKPATVEATLASHPQTVVTMLERGHGLGPEVLFALPAFNGTPAAKDKRLVSVPSYYLSFGPRTAHAARDLAAAVYPELKLPQLPPRSWTGATTTQ
ncbi:MAG: ABC transporter substrate-binding protein [Xanthobacteraceae bacterium]|nr:ABC transporter substrate-binding protein [Xanthobacteraceae bacterium]QYK46360.1 MAG: ABC transporter substrate-binding protein [Xanthobacteraceae bacterium]